MPSTAAATALFRAADMFEADDPAICEFLTEAAWELFRESLAAINRLRIMLLTDVEKRDHEDRIRLIAPYGVKGPPPGVRTETKYMYDRDDELGQIVGMTVTYELIDPEPNGKLEREVRA